MAEGPYLERKLKMGLKKILLDAFVYAVAKHESDCKCMWKMWKLVLYNVFDVSKNVAGWNELDS